MKKYYCNYDKFDFVIENETDQYDEIFENWSNENTIKSNQKNKSCNVLYVNNDRCEYFKNRKKIYTTKIHTKSDLYYIYYNYIYMLVNNKNTTLIHSSIFSIDKKNVCLLGDFGSGKTSMLENIKEKNIYSTDQTIIKIDKDGMYAISGSKFMRRRNSHDKCIKNNDKLIKVDIIIVLKGICAKGNPCLFEIDEKNRSREIYKNISWHYTIPLLSTNETLNGNQKNDIMISKRINTPAYYAYGDPQLIMDKIREMFKNE